jgi:hypothetical protein
MTKIGIGLGVGLLLVAAAAIAQPAGPPPGGRGGPGGPGGPAGGEGMGPSGPPPHVSKGASFRIADGNRRIFIKCADEDSTKSCMDAIGPLMNKLLESK